MQCLVTGATGFVGRSLVSTLMTSGAFVRGLARTPVASAASELVIADLAELPPDSPAFHGIDVVFHLAAKTHDMAATRGVEAEYQRVNVEGTRRVVAAARFHGVRRVVFVSSVKAIDEGNETPASEQTLERPLTPYGRSKLEAERLVREVSTAGAFESACLRFPLVYGPRQRGNLQRMIAAIARGRFPPPPDNGNRRSMLHVANAVDALVLAGSHPAAAGRVYIVTDAEPYSTRAIFDAVRAALGRSPMHWQVPDAGFRMLAITGDLARQVVGRRVGFDSDAYQKLLGTAAYDSTAIQRDLGFWPAHELRSSLPALIEDLRAQP